MAPGARVISLEELQQHKKAESCWLLLHGKVYDVTDFLEEHPGGYDIIVSCTGRDATKDFEEIGHSLSAKALLNKYLIGSYEGGDSMPAAAVAKPVEMQPSSSVSTSTRVFNVVLPVMVLAAAVAVNYYLAKRA